MPRGGAPLQCGEVLDDALGLSFEGGEHGARVYSVARCSQSTVRVENDQVPRGSAINRACRDHGLLLLNGRAASDRHGAFTHRKLHGENDTRSVIDLALVPREATADLKLVTVQ